MGPLLTAYESAEVYIYSDSLSHNVKTNIAAVTEKFVSAGADVHVYLPDRLEPSSFEHTYLSFHRRTSALKVIEDFNNQCGAGCEHLINHLKARGAQTHTYVTEIQRKIFRSSNQWPKTLTSLEYISKDQQRKLQPHLERFETLSSGSCKGALGLHLYGSEIDRAKRELVDVTLQVWDENAAHQRSKPHCADFILDQPAEYLLVDESVSHEDCDHYCANMILEAEASRRHADEHLET